MEQEQKTELKPCPFCGGGAEYVELHGDEWVACITCGAMTGLNVRGAASVMAAWDTRTERSDVRTEFGQILAGLKARGVITQDDVDRLERDGMKEVSHGG